MRSRRFWERTTRCSGRPGAAARRRTSQRTGSCTTTRRTSSTACAPSRAASTPTTTSSTSCRCRSGRTWTSAPRATTTAAPTRFAPTPSAVSCAAAPLATLATPSRAAPTSTSAPQHPAHVRRPPRAPTPRQATPAPATTGTRATGSRALRWRPTWCARPAGSVEARLVCRSLRASQRRWRVRVAAGVRLHRQPRGRWQTALSPADAAQIGALGPSSGRRRGSMRDATSRSAPSSRTKSSW
mmetsp:Transcript_3500/g.8366  ORF Transcript_3500/g.8366 Transcript_3500/m.8366 type:complete len:241 (+) Transcript_3500:1528-2250(+)